MLRLGGRQHLDNLLNCLATLKVGSPTMLLDGSRLSGCTGIRWELKLEGRQHLESLSLGARKIGHNRKQGTKVLGRLVPRFLKLLQYYDTQVLKYILCFLSAQDYSSVWTCSGCLG